MNLLDSIKNAILNGLLRAVAMWIPGLSAGLMAWWLIAGDGNTLLVHTLMQALPPEAQVSFANFLSVLSYVNLWFPVGEFFAMFAAYVSFLLALLAIKIPLKFIPTMPG